MENLQDDNPRYKPIENYGVIGDLHTVALVGIDGSIDFMCYPTFESPTIFASLLDHDKGGCFELRPRMDGARQKQLYLPDSNILLTRFLDDDGVAEISDFMTIERDRVDDVLVRRVKTVRGEVSYFVRFAPRFNYGRSGHTIEKMDGCYLFIPENKDQPALRLRTGVPLRVVNGELIGEFVLSANHSATFTLEVAEDGEESPYGNSDQTVEAFKETLNYWREWIGKCRYSGRWREMVNRSALVLKMLFYRPTGALVAAPTFGLPETIGGVRNWDYRYTWIRDATFTLYALMQLGYVDEARGFMNWIEQRCREAAPDGTIQLMYGITGKQQLTEITLDHWEGYKGSKPVRVGNAAFQQLQLDIYGELLDAVFLYDKHGEPMHHDMWNDIVRLVEWVCAHWRDPDHGIWEFRGGMQEFLFSKVMCWVAIDRAIKLSLRRSLPAPLDKWYRERDAIYNEVFNTFWCDELKSFVQYRGSTTLDASTLLMPVVRFISPTDPRWLSTMAAIRDDLMQDSLVYRYHPSKVPLDNLGGEEGSFCMCTFWYVECLSRSGDVDLARLVFEKMLGYANHLGLYAEELGPRGEFLGNFPQAFTHLSLIGAAVDLDRRLSAAGHPA